MQQRLQRSSRERMLFGVCGGLAEYFELDATLIRLLFVLITIAWGAGIIVYIVLAIVMPQAGSTAKEPRQVVRDNIAEMRTTAQEVGEELRSGLGRGESTSVQSYPAEGETVSPVRRASDRNATAGVILIALGVLFLLSNIGFLWWFNLRQLWPLILIAIGLAIIWRRGRS